MRWLVCLVLVGCGAPSPPQARVTVPLAVASTSEVDSGAQPVTQPPAATTLVALFEQKVSTNVGGFALDGQRLLVNEAGKLHVYDAHGVVAPSASRWKQGDPVVPVGDEAFDIASQTAHSPSAPQGECGAKRFSADGSRMSVDCISDDAVYVFDTRTGARIGVFKEFQTAAPVRGGAITPSGNFVFWASRASGAFEEIKSHVTGPVMSSHSVMAPDEHAIFTTTDRNWIPGETSPASMINPKNGRMLFTLPIDVDTVFFSPSGRYFAARHSPRWANVELNGTGAAPPGTLEEHASLTIHAQSADVFAKLPSAFEAAFANDDSAVAVRFESGVVRVYALR